MFLFFYSLEALDARLQRRIRLAMRQDSQSNNRDIMQLMTTVMQQSESVRERVNKRLRALGLSIYRDNQKTP